MTLGSLPPPQRPEPGANEPSSPPSGAACQQALYLTLVSPPADRWLWASAGSPAMTRAQLECRRRAGATLRAWWVPAATVGGGPPACDSDGGVRWVHGSSGLLDASGLTW